MRMLFVSSLVAAVGVWNLTPGTALVRHRLPWEVNDLLWPVAGSALAFLLSIPRPHTLFILLPLSLTLSFVARSRHAADGKRKRQRAIESELPTVVELLALAVSAGESPASALARVASICRGYVGRAMADAVEEISSGISLVRALEAMKAACANPQVDRFVDALILGYERGTSLNDVLHVQALDVREQHRRALIEHSARAEISMMVPVVFLIMPVTIVFALFPSLYALTSAQ